MTDVHSGALAMSDNLARGFLEDITAHPDDDAPRLIFADWLEEKGDSDRAEFIRVQIERARLPAWDARQVRLRLCERKLIEQHGQKWKKELPRIRGVRWEDFRRGFVATATFSSFAVLRTKASACWAAAPIEAISVHWPRRDESIDSIAPIAGLRELSLTNVLGVYRDIDQLAGAPLLSTLHAVNIRASGLYTEGFRRLVASPHLRNLTALRARSNSIGNGGISALFNAVSLTSLEELDLSEADSYNRYGEDPIIEARGMELLASWPGMARLRSLRLSGNSVGRNGLRALLRSPRATGLKMLILRDNGLDGSAMQEFGAAQPELQLDVLNLGGNLLRDLGAAELATAPCLRELKVLEVDRCEINLSGARRLAKAPFLRSLRRLNVNQSSFGPQGLHALLEKNPRELHTLQMVNNDLGDEGVSHLAESPASDSLLEVNLAHNYLGDHAAEALVKSKYLRNLLVLHLYDNPIDKPAVADLVASPLGKRLAILGMGDEDVPF
jgi:uncharacterized protein (TIGR02996 family)